MKLKMELLAATQQGPKEWVLQFRCNETYWSLFARFEEMKYEVGKIYDVEVNIS